MRERLRAILLPVPDGHGPALHALAEAFVSSPPWAALEHTVCVVRAEPEPAWGVLGWLDDAAAARVEAAAWQVPETLARLRYVDYAQAEADAATLAARLVERFGPAVRRYPTRGMPRGGFIVRGMLAYALDQPHGGLPDPADDPPTIIVDDCALSGARFRRLLEQERTGRFVLATLYSHPGLRRAVIESDDRIVDFLSARDLEDHAPRQLGDGYPDWVRRWQGRGDDYWVGNPDHVAFAWSEPDMTIWNPVSNAAEAGWRVVAPSQCLKNRMAGTPRLHRQPATATGTLPVAPDVLFGSVGDRRVIASASQATTLALEGTAAEIWDLLVATADEDETAGALVERYGVAADRAVADVAALAITLLDHGLIRRA